MIKKIQHWFLTARTNRRAYLAVLAIAVAAGLGWIGTMRAMIRADRLREEDYSGLKTVVVTGVGETAAAAKSDAYREAVGQVVTTIFASDTFVEDESLRENIMESSNAYVESSTVLKTWQEDGMTHVKIEAVVQKREMEMVLAPEGSSGELDGSHVVTATKQKIESEINSILQIEQKLRDFPYNCVDLKVEANFKEATPSGNEFTFPITVTLTPSEKKFSTLYKDIKRNLRVFSSNRGSVQSKDTLLPETVEKGANEIALYVAPSLNKDLKKITWDYYLLPKRAALYFSEKATTVPVIEIQLLDESGNSLFSNRYSLKERGLCNLAPVASTLNLSSRGETTGSYIDQEAAESLESLEKHCGDYFLAPVASTSMKTLTFSDTIRLDADKLEKVKRTKIEFLPEAIAVQEKIDNLKKKLDVEHQNSGDVQNSSNGSQNSSNDAQNSSNDAWE